VDQQLSKLLSLHLFLVHLKVQRSQLILCGLEYTVHAFRGPCKLGDVQELAQPALSSQVSNECQFLTASGVSWRQRRNRSLSWECSPAQELEQVLVFYVWSRAVRGRCPDQKWDALRVSDHRSDDRAGEQSGVC
jgi:hypothetical protein